MITKRIILSTLVVFSACRAPKFREPVLRCAYSRHFDICTCQKYSLNRVKPLEEMSEVSMSVCDRLVGFRAETWAKHITPKGREIRNYGKDRCR